MSSLDNKYRIHEVAKDFGMTSKVISQILTDYIAPPKNHMQVLENNELDVIFEYLTQNNQVSSLEQIFNVSKPEAESVKSADQKAGTKASKDDKAARLAKNAKTDKKPQPQVHAAPEQPVKKPPENKPHVPRKVAEKRVVDTRGGSSVNIEKYNEKFEDLAGSKTGENFRRTSKEKINSRQKQKASQQSQSIKRRQEERDKLNKLQLEIAKKQQLKVEIPDEISVGELASKMKKTASEVIK